MRGETRLSLDFSKCLHLIEKFEKNICETPLTFTMIIDIVLLVQC